MFVRYASDGAEADRKVFETLEIAKADFGRIRARVADGEFDIAILFNVLDATVSEAAKAVDARMGGDASIQLEVLDLAQSQGRRMGDLIRSHLGDLDLSGLEELLAKKQAGADGRHQVRSPQPAPVGEAARRHYAHPGGRGAGRRVRAGMGGNRPVHARNGCDHPAADQHTGTSRHGYRIVPDVCGRDRFTCVVDGDTIWYQGTNLRLQSYDTPEPYDGICGGQAEVALAKRASSRLLQLLNSNAFTVETFGIDGTGSRTLATVRIDGRDVGDILIEERLARRWPDGDEWWC